MQTISARPRTQLAGTAEKADAVQSYEHRLLVRYAFTSLA